VVFLRLGSGELDLVVERAEPEHEHQQAADAG
jgi:hypothetical protein